MERLLYSLLEILLSEIIFDQEKYEILLISWLGLERGDNRDVKTVTQRKPVFHKESTQHSWLARDLMLEVHSFTHPFIHKTLTGQLLCARHCCSRN